MRESGGRRRRDWPVALLYLAPAIAVFGVFVFYPLGRTIWLGFFREDLFGFNREYVGLEQYREVLGGQEFRNSLKVTFQYVLLSVPAALVLGTGLAMLAHQQLRGMRIFRTIFSSTVATSVAVAALLWFVLLQSSVGIVNQFLRAIDRQPVDWLVDPDRALFAVSLTTVWQNLGIVFVTVIAGLQSLPEELHEAARVDGHSSWSRFWRITIPMLSPTLLFASVVLVIRTLQTVGEIDLLTQGGPAERTNVLVYALYQTVSRDPGVGSAFAVVLFVLILALTLLQFRFLERRVHYGS
jgi:sn-glycerol 3-phosphate transport system permease protein